MQKKYGIIILAAGGSSRLGSPKQLLPFNGGTLLSHVVSEALLVGEATVIVVSGAYRDEVEKVIRQSGVSMVYNAHWQTGMASSIKAGVSELLSSASTVDSCIIAVCDQPYVNATVFNSLIAGFEGEGKAIVASSYSDTVGTPVLFGKAYFTQLLELEGDEGAKKLLRVNEDDVVLVPFSRGEIDVDTRKDYEKIA